MSATGRAWKVAAAVAALVCTGAAATAVVGVKIHRYYFEGRGTDGSYHFRSEPEMVYGPGSQDANGAKSGYAVGVESTTVISSTDPNFTLDVEQTRQDLEEVALLRQQGAGELIGVIDTEVNGHFHRTFRYRYTLADGRTQTMGEGDPDERVPRTPEQVARDHEEIARLREQGRRELVRVIDVQVGDDLQRMCSYEYVLADGRTLDVGENDPELPPSAHPLGPEQTREVWRLRGLKQGEFLGTSDRDVLGRTFTFETYVLTLADGTVVTHAIGEPKGLKASLTDADWKEFRTLREAGKGEDLGMEEKMVKNRLFSFQRQRFVLSDGTEFIWSPGEPKENR